MKSPLIPSILYTEGNDKINKEIEKELEIKDPKPEVAEAAIKEAKDETNKVSRKK